MPHRRLPHDRLQVLQDQGVDNAMGACLSELPRADLYYNHSLAIRDLQLRGIPSTPTVSGSRPGQDARYFPANIDVLTTVCRPVYAILMRDPNSESYGALLEPRQEANVRVIHHSKARAARDTFGDRIGGAFLESERNGHRATPTHSGHSRLGTAF